MNISIIISQILQENFIEIRQFVQEISGLSLSVFASVINFQQFFEFLTFPYYKETNDINLQQMMLAFFHFEHTFNRLFNKCIKLY